MTSAADDTKPIDVPPHARNIGNLPVRHLLPAKERRMVGPFIFLDHMGPATIPSGVDSDVRPHPHIGLATVTYLFHGEMVHRDSLGSVQTIRPGEINWMTAGKGIVHSERATDKDKSLGRSIHGLQLWVALPKEHEDHAPEFHHYARDVLPSWTSEAGVELALLAGNAYGRVAPVRTLSPLFYVEAKMPAGATLVLPEEHPERAVYVIDGAVKSDDVCPLTPWHLFVFPESRRVELRATTDTHLVILGGAQLDGHRSAYWNFVSSSREKIEQAKKDWREGRFQKIPGDDGESIPLPEDAQ
jgi:redox-sensitive bicupin YhaK (pirin superfamily)